MNSAKLKESARLLLEVAASLPEAPEANGVWLADKAAALISLAGFVELGERVRGRTTNEVQGDPPTRY